MNRFILIYQIIKDASDIEFAKVGVCVPDMDYLPNVAKEKIRDAYFKKYPGSHIAIKLHSVKQVSEKEYNAESVNFNVNMK